ncbi:MAG: hypothetical protein ACKO22_00250 [Cyanobium sp.]
MALFKVQGIVYRRVLSDNGFAYKSHGWRNAVQALAVKVKKTRPYTPRTNGKAERFINSLLGEWAHVMPCGSSEGRFELLQVFLRIL